MERHGRRPLPITIETTEAIERERRKDFTAFLAAHREGILYAKANREKVIALLTGKFGHGRSLAEKTFDDYMPWMDETLRVDKRQFTRLLNQVAAEASGGGAMIAAEWIVPAALKE